jgi:hypothetical protein
LSQLVNGNPRIDLLQQYLKQTNSASLQSVER